MPRTGKRGRYKLRPLSEKQKNMFKFLVEYIQKNEFPPSIRETGDAVGIDSTSVVNYNLNKLEEHGLILRWREVSRGIKIIRPRARELGFQVDDIDTEKMMTVPVLGNIVASNPVDVGEAHTWQSAEEWVNVATDLVDDPRYVYALRVQGDSMIDANIQDNDLVLMRATSTPRNGDMVCAWVEGNDEMTLKRYYLEGDTVRLQPASPDKERYQPIIHPADKVKVQGKVLVVIRSL